MQLTAVMTMRMTGPKHHSSTAATRPLLTGPTGWGRVASEVSAMLQPCDPDATMWLLRLALTEKPEDVDLGLVFELVAQLVTDLRAWPDEP